MFDLAVSINILYTHNNEACRDTKQGENKANLCYSRKHMDTNQLRSRQIMDK